MKIASLLAVIIFIYLIGGVFHFVLLEYKKQIMGKGELSTKAFGLEKSTTSPDNYQTSVLIKSHQKILTLIVLFSNTF